MAHASQQHPSVRRKSYDLKPRREGTKGRPPLSPSGRTPCVTLPPIDVVPSPMSLKRTDAARSKKRSVCDDDTKWLISKLAEMSFCDKEEEPRQEEEEEEEEEQPESMTPEPELFKHFRVFENGIAVLTEEQKMRSSYRPRYCWCYRCQTMFYMYKANDPTLENWGNYPCHQW